jgi:hypothetical protein
MPRLPLPKTCTEAADRIASQYSGMYTASAHVMLEVAFTLKAFGETPVPQPILDRWEWSRIGDPESV